jgi:hypothetical protein
MLRIYDMQILRGKTLIASAPTGRIDETIYKDNVISLIIGNNPTIFSAASPTDILTVSFKMGNKLYVESGYTNYLFSSFLNTVSVRNKEPIAAHCW